MPSPCRSPSPRTRNDAPQMKRHRFRSACAMCIATRRGYADARTLVTWKHSNSALRSESRPQRSGRTSQGRSSMDRGTRHRCRTVHRRHNRIPRNLGPTEHNPRSGITAFPGPQRLLAAPTVDHRVSLPARMRLPTLGLELARDQIAYGDPTAKLDAPSAGDNRMSRCQRTIRRRPAPHNANRGLAPPGPPQEARNQRFKTQSNVLATRKPAKLNRFPAVNS